MYFLLYPTPGIPFTSLWQVQVPLLESQFRHFRVVHCAMQICFHPYCISSLTYVCGGGQECFAVRPDVDGMLDVSRKTFLQCMEDIFQTADTMSEEYGYQVKVRAFTGGLWYSND